MHTRPYMHMRTYDQKFISIFSLFLCITLLLNAQQAADTTFIPTIANPAYSKAQGPVIFIDEAHDNFHTIDGRFKPFASVLQRDGYTVVGFKEVFTNRALAAGKILVIANALNPINRGKWSLPTPSAFTDEEISEVNAWVKNGGSLFLIADHMPFPGAAEKLAASFGVKFYNGFARKKGIGGNDIFKPGKGLLECPLTKGRNLSETVISLQSFTGQAFQIPDSARAIIQVNDRYELLLPQTAGEFKKDTETISADKFVQGAYMTYGRGRIVVFGEAAMFTAQTQGNNKFGMNATSAFQNVQFLLNTIHWLDGLIK